MAKFIKVHSVVSAMPEIILINAEIIEVVVPCKNSSLIYTFAVAEEPSGSYEVAETVDEIWAMLNEK